MNSKTTIAVAIVSLCALASAKAQRIDTLLGRLPSHKTYFVPHSLSDSLMPSPDSSRYELLSYLAEGVPTASERLAYLSSRLAMPLVVRPVVETKRLSVELSPLNSLGGQSLRVFGELEKYLERYDLGYRIGLNTLQYVQSKSIGQSIYTERSLAEGREQLAHSERKLDAQDLFKGKLQPNSIKEYADQLSVAEIERKYWLWGLESSIQFSQNYISDNWHKGGNSNLNLSMRNYLSLKYSKERVQWLNELESKLGLYTADVAEESARYRISEDRLRLHSNFGIKLNKRWSYTLDGEMRTQLFKIYNSNQKVLQSAFFAPVRTNLGIGMQYSYSHKSRKRYGRKVSVALNLAPLSHNWRWSSRDDIDLRRHGLSPDKRSVHTFGSTFRADINWNFNMDLSWQSRVYFNTSYESVEAEWENTLVMRISRYFSTRINLHLRYDDSAKPSSKWNRYLQINEVLSFGFNYKL